MPYVRNILPSMVRAYRVICRGAAGCIPLPKLGREMQHLQVA